MSFEQCVSIIKDSVLTVAAAVGAYVAIRGLTTWNRQLKGSVEYDLARRLLKTAYKIREAMKSVRNPIMWGAEMPAPPQEKAGQMSPEEIHHYGKVQAYEARWQKVIEPQTELEADLLEPRYSGDRGRETSSFR